MHADVPQSDTVPPERLEGLEVQLRLVEPRQLAHEHVDLRLCGQRLGELLKQLGAPPLAVVGWKHLGERAHGDAEEASGPTRQHRNDGLTDVTALYGVGVGNDLTVTDNPNLGDAAAQALVDQIGSIGGSVTISGNQ